MARAPLNPLGGPTPPPGRLGALDEPRQAQVRVVRPRTEARRKSQARSGLALLSDTGELWQRKARDDARDAWGDARDTRDQRDTPRKRSQRAPQRQAPRRTLRRGARG
ncbi:MAG: hypothetical protein J2P50_05810 [Hyphomicrobiaceae bacterium]|nr:hypothetical protein [Hyphomicrobiaceae bacterium]